jgi:MerR family Zn(II)-responsive transcriptional regulator of zntA
MYTIGQLARRAHVNTDSVRFYERQGLLSPGRKTSAGYRLYSDEALQRIAFVKHAQRCGFSLAEIRDLLHMREDAAIPPSQVHRFVQEKRSEIDVTITALQTMSRYLADLASKHPLNSARAVPAGANGDRGDPRPPACVSA